jgi:hypothetical protein
MEIRTRYIGALGGDTLKTILNCQFELIGGSFSNTVFHITVETWQKDEVNPILLFK